MTLEAETRNYVDAAVPDQESHDDEIYRRAQDVKNAKATATASWLSIATKVRAAKDALKSPSYTKFLNLCSLSDAVANKLVKIADCKLLYSESNERILSRIDGWSVLYELAKLESAQLQRFLEDANACPEKAVTRESISSFRATNQSPNKTVVICTLSVSAEEISKLTKTKMTNLFRSIEIVRTTVSRGSSIISMSVNKSKIDELDKIASRFE